MTEIKTNKLFSPFKEISIAPLIIFRIIFGVLMFLGTVRFISKGWVQQLYIDPSYYFGYLGFEWVKPLEGQLMYIPFILLLISALCIIVGLFYRASALTFSLCFTYIELLDKSNYLNHYYFVSLMALIMLFLPANRNFSFDAKIWPKIKSITTKQWTVSLIKFQLAMVYIFAGIAKVNSDWLIQANPLKIWLQAHHNIPLVGSLMQEDWLAYTFSWAGCIYDLFIVFFLLSNRCRPIAYLFVVFFHLATWYLFPIGVFPWVMIFSTLIFFSAQFHERVLDFFSRKTWRENPVKPKRLSSLRKKQTRYLLTLYIIIQLLLPFRYVLYPGDLFWNEEGFRFSWRVMLMHKEGHATFYMVDPKTGRESEINNSKFLTRTQEDQMATQPDMILQYAQILKNYHHGKTFHYGDQKITVENPEIRAKIYVSLNGRPAQLFVDKKHDLTKLNYNLYHRTWLEPFKK
ncbi:MAG: HTTM domain-containing protein [Crocinitomicaceae bacterium]|nr:HTTM domain-containing protein [Crocinitomicaceae bacterium]MDG1776232.1 HTTM domain-containing protein [Crocinitomicaceae bacterium]